MGNISILLSFAVCHQAAVRWMCDAAANAGEVRLADILKQRFPQATGVEVRDISGKLICSQQHFNPNYCAVCLNFLCCLQMISQKIKVKLSEFICSC